MTAYPDAVPVPLHDLTFLNEDGQVIIGRGDIESFAVFPPEGAEVVTKLADGMTPAQAAQWYQAAYGEALDTEDFLDTLHELGFIRADDATATAPAGKVRGQAFARVLFSWPAAAFALGLIAVAGWLMMTEPVARPRWTDVFVSHYTTVSLLVVLFGQIPGLLLHEGAHMLAARRLGLPSRIRLGRRLIFLVVETQMNGLVGVPRRKRYLPYLAGMIADVAWFSVLTAAAALSVTGGHMTIAGNVMLSLAFMTLLRLGWQLYFYLQTDLYFVLADTLRCTDLHGATKALIRDWIGRLPRIPQRPIDPDSWSSRDLAVARWYAIPYLAGCTWSIAVTVVWILPIVIRFMTQIADGLTGAHGMSASTLADSGTGFAIYVTELSLLTWVVINGRRARKPRRSHQ